MDCILDKKKYPEFWSLCRTTTYGLLGGTALGVFGGTCQAVINSKSIPKYAMSTGANMGMLSCCFFGVQEILAYARNKRDVWNSVGAGATSGFISFAAYGGPRFGVFGTIIMSTVGFGGHYVGEKIIFAKDEFVKARRKHLKRSEIKK